MGGDADFKQKTWRFTDDTLDIEEVTELMTVQIGEIEDVPSFSKASEDESRFMVKLLIRVPDARTQIFQI